MCLIATALWLVQIVGVSAYVIRRVGHVERNLNALVRQVQEMKS